MERTMRRSVLWLAAASCLACLWPGRVQANGGGYTFGVQFTGSVAPFQAAGTEQVRIEEEKLDVALRRGAAAVTVRYTMRNQTSAPARVRFGFPVEATRLDDGECEETTPQAALSACRRKDLQGSIPLLHGYTVTADGAPVKAEFLLEPFAQGKVKPFPGAEALKGIAGWMVSEVTFPAGRPLALEIRYSADHLFEEASVSDDEVRGPSTFVYRLSTGAVWNGPIEKGTITVRADGIAADEVKILKGGLTRKGDAWVRELVKLEPTLADDLEIQAVPGWFVPGMTQEEGQPQVYQHFLQRGGDRSLQGGPWGGAHQRFTATASSSLAPAKDHDFGPAHLAAERGPGHEAPTSPWCEGVAGSGVGEWVELTPATPRRLLGLSVFPGFQRERLYAANGRPSRVEVLLNGEHRFVAALDEVAPKTGAYGAAGAQFIPVVGYDRPVKKLRITLLEVKPGAKYDDTCIHKVLLYDLLEKAPKISPAR
jgi:hypothetical protein